MGGIAKKLRVTSRGMVLESFNVSFFSTAGVSEGREAEDDSVDDVLVSGTSDPSSEEDELPPNSPFSFPEAQMGRKLYVK
jgi:hypothetical protein